MLCSLSLASHQIRAKTVPTSLPGPCAALSLAHKNFSRLTDRLTHSHLYVSSACVIYALALSVLWKEKATLIQESGFFYDVIFKQALHWTISNLDLRREHSQLQRVKRFIVLWGERHFKCVSECAPFVWGNCTFSATLHSSNKRFVCFTRENRVFAAQMSHKNLHPVK